MASPSLRLQTGCYSRVAEQHPITFKDMLRTGWTAVTVSGPIQHRGQRLVPVNSYSWFNGCFTILFVWNLFEIEIFVDGWRGGLWMDTSPALRNLRSHLSAWETPFEGMFRKINNAFRPNHQGQRGWDGSGGGGIRSEHDYHNACTVRLVRSTSMLVVGEKTQTAAAGSTLKRSKSTVSIESTLYYYQRQEDRIWLYSHQQNCLEYLEALVALRRRYTKSVSDLKSADAKATVFYKKKPAPPPPSKEAKVGVQQEESPAFFGSNWNWSTLSGLSK